MEDTGTQTKEDAKKNGRKPQRYIQVGIRTKRFGNCWREKKRKVKGEGRRTQGSKVCCLSAKDRELYAGDSRMILLWDSSFLHTGCAEALDIPYKNKVEE